MGAMGEPLACCLHGIDMTEIKPGSTVVVIGGGMIGLLMLQLCKLKGSHKTIMLEPVSEKRKVAKDLGADLCIDPINQDVRLVLSNEGIFQVDAVIECVGLPSTIKQAIDIAGKNSTVMMFGLTKPDDVVEIKPFELFQKEIVLKASYINPYTLGRAIKLINSKKVDVTSMVSGVEPLDYLPEILSSSEVRRKGKYIINPWI
jgi:threonine dehydrogenase-like Zn-dependent dehydrogenase